MNKVVTIHLRGTAFQLEEAGYEALRAYLDDAARRLEGNPDRDEIIADIEQAIADKCRAVLGAYKNVVVTHEIEQVIAEMGPVEDAPAESGANPAAEGTAAPGGAGRARPGAAPAESKPEGPVRRLYRIPNGVWSPGVCSGLAAYFNIDVSLVRFVFLFFTLFWGIGFVAYVLLIFLMPIARTPAEKVAAHGPSTTAQEFIRRAREGYYEGMRTFRDRHAHREWRRRFKRDMRGWGRQFKQEMQESACRWQQHWQAPNWTPGPAPTFALLVTLPFLALLRGMLAVIGLLALISLLVTHTVFGLAPPAGMPLWVAVILLIVIYNIVVWPLRALRHAWHWQVARGPALVPPLFWAVDAIIGLGCVVVLFWLVDRHVPQAHEALMALPAAIHHGADTVRHWWTTR